MAAPNMSANVPANQRFRVVYRLTSPIPALFGGADERITAAWYDSPALAVVIAPATTPAVGGTTRLTGPTEAFTSIDIKAPHNLQTVTWDRYLEPFRRPSLGMILGLGVAAELRSVELLTPAQLSLGTAPAARTGATQTPAQTSLEREAARPTLGGLVTTATKRALLVGLLVLAIVVAWQMGPDLMKLVKGRK